MWPKAISQLIELLPHVARLLPLADRFFSAKSADAEASRTAMEQMAQGLRGDLGQVTASHAGLYRQLNEQSEKLGTIAADVHATRDLLKSNEGRIATLESSLALHRKLLVALVLLNAVTLVVVIVRAFAH
jgi:septal ring factor EnvC (AmiA/AmiB activator)